MSFSTALHDFIFFAVVLIDANTCSGRLSTSSAFYIACCCRAFLDIVPFILKVFNSFFTVFYI